MLKQIILVGSGNAAEALGDNFVRAGIEFRLCARNVDRATELSARWQVDRVAFGAPTHADLWILSVSDRAVADVACALPLHDCTVVHTAGALPYETIPPREGCTRGVFYPLQTFTVGRRVDLQTVPIFVESEHPTVCRELAALARRLSQQVVFSTPEMRANLHVAAVFACNFVNQMFVAAEEWCRREQIDNQLMKPLIAETVAKYLDSDVAATELQTGPAARGDRNTVEKHLALLQRDLPQWSEIYEIISKKIANGKL